MDMQDQNPTRRYKGFHPRQAAWGMLKTGTPTNRSTIIVFNDSRGSHVLMIRHIVSLVAAEFNIGLVQGNLGAVAAGYQQSFFPTEAKVPGLFSYVDSATNLGGAAIAAVAGLAAFPWQHDFPIVAVPPGWSFFAQLNATAAGIGASIMWEAVLPDEIDFFE